ncbi:glycosyltransferase family 4 protein [Scytonema tolypothrichoides VB-61278]|nr:glycosyltransferase family 4 protein [Scytonema tolypothrichoides VB-61278]
MQVHKVNYEHEKYNENYQSLRVAQVASVWFSVPPKDYGGTESLISNLSEELIKQGHHVTLFASGDSQTSGELKYYIEKYLFSMPGTSWYNETEAEYHLISSFREIAKHPEKYDIVHIHISSASDLIGLKLASQLKLPHICTLHNRFPFDLRKNYLGEADKYYFTWGEDSPLIAISNSAKENALLDFGSPLNFIGVIHHGLPDHEFLKEEISQRRYLVWIGGINRRKGTKTAIEAAIKAKRKIIIAGVVDRNTPESLAYFEQEVLPLIEQNPDDAEYIGPVNSKQRFELLKNAYCFLNPIAWEEPFGLVMIEAMACGCPVISFRRGAAKELIKPGKNGAFAASVDEMAAMIESIGNNIDRKQMVTDTWNDYSITKTTERYVMKYREVLGLT